MSIKFLLLHLLLTTDLSQIKVSNVTWEKFQVGPHGSYYAATKKKFFQWDTSGTLIGEISPAGNDQIFISFFINTSEIFISEVGSEIITRAYDHDRKFIAESKTLDNFIYKFWQTSDTIYGMPFVSNAYLAEEPFLFLAHKIDIRIADNELVVTTKPSFMKLKQRQADLRYDYINIWIVHQGEKYYVVNQIENYVYEYDNNEILREKKEGTKNPTTVPSTTVNLPNYAHPPKSIFSIDRPVTASTYREMLSKWNNSWSQITWFGKKGTGYVISYEIPDCDPPGSGECFSKHLGIQRLDDSFSPIGELIETQGHMMGVNPEGKICVFQSNPIRENGVVVGDRPKIFLFD